MTLWSRWPGAFKCLHLYFNVVMNANYEKKIVLNFDYKIRMDGRRALIVNVNEQSETPKITHPVLAAMFSFFKGDKCLGSVCDEISAFFDMPKDKVESLVNGFINNKANVKVKFDGTVFSFPADMLIENKCGIIRRDFKTKDFLLPPPYDFETLRLSSPTDVLFVINTKCVTDCVYCYADKKTQYQAMPTYRILKIIEEACDIGVRTFELSGGEVFLHKDWKKIVNKLIDYGYCDFVSTKIPLSRQQIDEVANTGLKTLQVSLDSLNPKTLACNLNVGEEYCQKMKESLLYLDTKGIEIIVKGTHTRHTFNKENVKEVIDFISKLKHLKKYTVSTIGASMYKSNESFQELKPTLAQVREVYDYLDGLDCGFYIQNDDQTIKRDELCNIKKFNERTLCSGNVLGLTILPDGKVTICEELYWNPDFIIGDLMKNGLLEVWNSEKALSLWNIRQSVFPQESACSTCQDFARCRRGAGACWKYVIGAYGRENWLYPDPRCPKAPNPINNVCYD